MRSNNKIIKQFAQGNGFGFNYYLENNESQLKEIKYLKDISTSVKNESPSEIKCYKEEEINNINSDIDKLLNFYMSQLNEKLDDSINSLDEDDPILSNLNYNQNNLNLDNISDNKNEHFLKADNISEIYNNSTLNNNKSSSLNNILEKNSTNNEKIEQNGSSRKCEYSLEKKDNSIEEDFKINYDNFIVEEGLENQDIIDKKEDNLIENKSDICKQLNKEEFPAHDSNIKNDVPTDILNNTKSTEIKNQIKNFPDVRLTKSCEIGYLRQDFEQFDIEYMCKCLGLALMKHLESSHDKLHIMDLINFKENFSFFNSIFNLNIDFFNTFFNFEEKISNLDKLDLRVYEEKNKNHKEIKNSSEENQKNIPISYVSHIGSSKGDINLSKENKLISNYESSLFYLEKDEKIINDYFKLGHKISDNSRYNDVNQNTKQILCEDLKPINEIDSMEYCNKNQLNTIEKKKENSNYLELLKQSMTDFIGNENEKQNIEEDEFIDYNDSNTQNSYLNENKEEKFTSYKVADEGQIETEDYFYKETPIHKIPEEINEKDDLLFESGLIESNYIIDVTTAEKLKNYVMKTAEIYDDDYDYSINAITHKRHIPTPDPQQIFEFCINVIINTKMEKEVIIICLIYIERFIFNTGILINSRNWKRLIFTSLIISSKIWDDDSFENNHFAQVFTHLKIGEINMLERTYLELINYKVFVKCSEYFKYFFIIKSIALKYNFNGLNIVPISVERMMLLQEHAFQIQKKLRKKYSYNNSAEF